MSDSSVTMEKVQQEFLKPFVEGAVTTLTTMASMSPSPIRIEVAGDAKFLGDVSAVTGLSGERIEGFVGISFRDDLAKIVVSRVLGLDPSELEDGDITDGVGELINMITGSAKNALLGTPYQFQTGLPNVITGRDHAVGYPKAATCWNATLEVEEGQFHLLIAYAQK